MRALPAVVIATLAGCYKPSAFDDPCAIACMPAIGCPDGLTCGGDLRCHAGSTECSDQPVVDAPLDDDATSELDASMVDTPSGVECFGTGMLVVCPVDPGSIPGDITLSSTLSTDSSPACNRNQNIGGRDYCVVVANRIVVPTSVRVSGTRGLVLVARERIAVSIGGELDASEGGAGSNPDNCQSSSAPPVTMQVRASGGPGGSFATSGGDGGAGTSGAVGANPPSTLAPRGGCHGGAGGSSEGLAGGSAGLGGGMLYLIAKEAISVSGTLRVTGAPGGGAQGGLAGGGGGGSGGLIVIDAPTTTMASTAFLLAHGGGGGGGTAGGVAQPGMAPTADGSPGQPGASDVDTGNAGGYGSPGLANAETMHGNGAGVGGGGGGGGGAGYIKAYGNVTGSTNQAHPAIQ